MGPKYVLHNGQIWFWDIIQNFLCISFVFWEKCDLQLFLPETVLLWVKSDHQVPRWCNDLQKYEFSLCQMEKYWYEWSHIVSPQISISLLLAQTIFKKYQSKSKAKNLVGITTKARLIDTKVHGTPLNRWIISLNIILCEKNEEKV